MQDLKPTCRWMQRSIQRGSTQTSRRSGWIRHTEVWASQNNTSSPLSYSDLCLMAMSMVQDTSFLEHKRSDEIERAREREREREREKWWPATSVLEEITSARGESMQSESIMSIGGETLLQFESNECVAMRRSLLRGRASICHAV